MQRTRGGTALYCLSRLSVGAMLSPEDKHVHALVESYDSENVLPPGSFSIHNHENQVSRARAHTLVNVMELEMANHAAALVRPATATLSDHTHVFYNETHGGNTGTGANFKMIVSTVAD